MFEGEPDRSKGQEGTGRLMERHMEKGMEKWTGAHTDRICQFVNFHSQILTLEKNHSVNITHSKEILTESLRKVTKITMIDEKGNRVSF